ncbi:UNVERIFIED_CONTAM: putative ribonuclease H protein [Sesamum angustifolium]|uniref:Ribonuclease H protein n=1 Tax=Sesamum angustifolium TaxID=2727405 RepID=A0AAW2JGS9_9LAMI
MKQHRLSPLQRHEIREALADINEDSAPGPDGFSSGFFKASWDVIGEDVCRAVMEFFNHDRLLKQLNATLITLIPKVQLPTKVGDFRPIACCNVIYKIITKIMVKRMQLVLEKLVDNCQNAFVPGRSISDNVLLAQELLSGYNQKKLPPRCAIKVDLQKAYDMVNWDYLLAVLRLFRFPNRFILWNDDNFQFHWRCKELNLVNLCLPMTCYYFAKLTYIHSATVLHGVLQEFKGRAGLQANAQKSQILFSKAAAQIQNQIQNLLGFPQGTCPVRYLGVPLITSKLSLADCAPLILKIETRIAGWNQLKLTYAGRTQLIKSVLSSILQYWCSVFILPKGVIKVIEAKLRNFLWKGGTESGGYKVAWEQVCKPTSHGGLGIRNIQAMNNALMGKHLWQVLTKKQDSIWVSWILKYKLKNGSLWAAKDNDGSWTWKKLLKLRNQLYKGIQFQVGDGTDFKLWLDPWHPDGTLLHRYPHGPLITGIPMDSTLSTVIVSGNWQWPSEHHVDVNDIITKLPDIHSGAMMLSYGTAARAHTPQKLLMQYSPVQATQLNGRLYFMGRFIHQTQFLSMACNSGTFVNT